MAAAAGGYVLASMPSAKITKMPHAVFNKEYKMKVPYKLKQGQSRIFHQLPSGLNMEIIFQEGVRNEQNKKLPIPAPLVFVHGSFHAAWCWAEHWLPFFSQNGFDSYALSLLGQVQFSFINQKPNFIVRVSNFGSLGKIWWLIGSQMFQFSILPFIHVICSPNSDSSHNLEHWQGESDAPDGSVAGSLQSHASDIADFIKNQTTLSPVLIGHSFGGLIVQYYIANLEKESNLAGAVLVCSVPPTGNSGLVWRYLFTKPVAAFKVTMSLAAKAFQTSLPLCKETFFSREMDDHLVLRYQELMTESSRMPLFDLRKLNASLPVTSVPDPSTRVLVMGAADDFIVDAKGLEETGSFYGVKPVCVNGVAHDMMLDSSWEKGAQLIVSWIQNDVKSLTL
ncbi:hypothetical protein SSX86_016328 [Deinandra increscens subsp. villosa]|uniref:AB hydrolase-1 domain-containing protein n=1 Tax=Deinandra increscens subsp. villosa TaxID=3103831 RepID=A0AAP0CXR9_9ASTR